MNVTQSNIFAALPLKMRSYVHILNYSAGFFVYIRRFRFIGDDPCAEPKKQLNLTIFWLK